MISKEDHDTSIKTQVSRHKSQDTSIKYQDIRHSITFRKEDRLLDRRRDEQKTMIKQ